MHLMIGVERRKKKDEILSDLMTESDGYVRTMRMAVIVAEQM